MKTYLVNWQIEVDAESAEQAARAAQVIQRDPRSTATVFDVVEDKDGMYLNQTEVDLVNTP